MFFLLNSQILGLFLFSMLWNQLFFKNLFSSFFPFCPYFYWKNCLSRCILFNRYFFVILKSNYFTILKFIRIVERFLRYILYGNENNTHIMKFFCINWSYIDFNEVGK